ncbi:MAG: replicative DNA helicase [Bacteroidales bacterium]
MTNTNYPHNLNAEAELLGCMMIHHVKFEEIFAALSAEMFYDYAHQLIFASIHHAFLKHGKVDLILTEQALVEQDALQKAGGMLRLSEIYAQANRFKNYMAHLALIRESYILRRIMLMAHTLCVKASSEQYESELLIEECNAQLNELMQLNAADDRVFTSRKVMDAVVTEYEERKANVEKGETNGLLTGITNFDRISNGLQNGDLTILAGRPSMGKTAVAIHMGMTMARNNKHVLVFSLEMTAVQLGNRMLLNESNIPIRHFKAGTLYPQHEAAMRETADQIANRSITIADIPGISMAQIRNIALRQQRNMGVDVIPMVYLHTLTA